MAGIDLDDLDAQQVGNLIYALIIEDAAHLGDVRQARHDLDALLAGEPRDTVPERDTWGLGPGAEEALEAMKMMGN